MQANSGKNKYFDDSFNFDGLSDLGIDKSKLIRTIESLRVDRREITPSNVALNLGLPRSFIYSDPEALETIYKNTDLLSGHDKLISILIKDIKSRKKKIVKLKKELEQNTLDQEKVFNDGFAKGASMNFSRMDQEPVSKQKEAWARGVLYLDASQDLTEETIKKAYRRMMSLIHPDSSGKETENLVHSLSKAYEYLLKNLVF